MKIITSLAILLLAALPAAAADMEWVKVSDDNSDFVLAESGKPFIPWGFNYDHEGDGIYPEKGKVDDAIETLKGFAAVGKPVVIEEIFPLKCGAKELGDFIDQSRKHATGWIGFYWGKKPDELRPATTIPEAMTLSWLELFQEKTPQILGEAGSLGPPQYHNTNCEGTYQHHLQGICLLLLVPQLELDFGTTCR